MKNLFAACTAVAILAAPASAQGNTQVRDARCAYVKSVFLGEILDVETPDQQRVAGVISNITYYFGRLEATMSRNAIADLIVQQAAVLDTRDKMIEAEGVCDKHLEGTMDFMVQVGNRLDQAGK